MRLRLTAKIVPLTLLAVLVLAPVARAENDGRGFYGATNDKVVTNFGFAVIAFFALFVFTMSMIQRALDKRKEARKAAAKRLSGAQWRGGW
jgi:flagellar biosynthesis/type III secretory pathway M-ring protein FliF/YscJ